MECIFPQPSPSDRAMGKMFVVDTNPFESLPLISAESGHSKHLPASSVCLSQRAMLEHNIIVSQCAFKWPWAGLVKVSPPAMF